MSFKRHKNSYDGKIAGLYDMEETIGKGHFAVVKVARHVFTGEKVAIKIIDKCKLDAVAKAHLFQEVRCMKLVQHPNIVKLYEVIDTQTKLYLILELGDGGDMYDYIMKHRGGLREDHARKYFQQIVQAINYCHQLHVVHRDLKPENVVFFEKLGIVKLTDFGFSNKFVPGRKLETSCGSLAYSAPEILLGESYDAPAVDVWSLGVLLYMLVCGELPFQEANDSETLTMIMDCRYKMPNHISRECQNLIKKLLVRNPNDRATLAQILVNVWVCCESENIETLIPLISLNNISENDKEYIFQKMVDGKIASREEIVSCLEDNAYDHKTATFYLLAERLLRKQYEDLKYANGKEPHNFNEISQNGISLNCLTKITQKDENIDSSSHSKCLHNFENSSINGRPCSLIEEENDDGNLRYEDNNPIVSKCVATSLSVEPSIRHFNTNDCHQSNGMLRNAMSSPQLVQLNEICEENEEDDLPLPQTMNKPGGNIYFKSLLGTNLYGASKRQNKLQYANKFGLGVEEEDELVQCENKITIQNLKCGENSKINDDISNEICSKKSSSLSSITSAELNSCNRSFSSNRNDVHETNDQFFACSCQAPTNSNSLIAKSSANDKFVNCYTDSIKVIKPDMMQCFSNKYEMRLDNMVVKNSELSMEQKHENLISVRSKNFSELLEGFKFISHERNVKRNKHDFLSKSDQKCTDIDLSHCRLQQSSAVDVTKCCNLV